MYQSPTLHADGNRFTHVGLCVSDLERSLRYYCDVLGFEEKARLTVDDEDSANLLGVPGLNVELVFVERDGIRLEMLWHRPGHTGDGEARPMNQLGLTHLCFRVGDFDDLCARIAAGGGVIVPGTNAVFQHGNRGIMTLDPDGIRVELIERPKS